MKKSIAILLLTVLLLSLSACFSSTTASLPPAPSEDAAVSPSILPEPSTPPSPIVDDTPISFGAIKGPTGMGASYLIDNAPDNYSVTLAAAPTEIVAMLNNSELDIACMPTNLAATLYNKTKGEIQILALNTKCVLHILENGDTIKSVADLRGKTLYATGQAANPEYILSYILTKNGLKPGVDVTIEWLESDELSTRMASGDIKLAMIPVPAATTVTVKNKDVRYALDFNELWTAAVNDKSLIQNGASATAQSDSGIYMGCVVVRTAFLKEHPAAVSAFLEKYSNSVDVVLNPQNHPELKDFDAGALFTKTEIVGNAAIGNAALPYSGICLVTGAENIKAAIANYYQILFDYDPSSIGGSIPGDDFYAVLK